MARIQRDFAHVQGREGGVCTPLFVLAFLALTKWRAREPFVPRSLCSTTTTWLLTNRTMKLVGIRHAICHHVWGC